MTFEKWFQDQDFYKNMRFIHGDALFIKDSDIYRVLPVQMAFEAWESRQAVLEEKDKRIEEASEQLKGFLRMVEEDLICDEAIAKLIVLNLKGLEKALRGAND